MKCTTLYSYELDDKEAAWAEIKSQLDSSIQLLKNSVGVVMCHPEFKNTEVFKHICSKLPFETVGVTTASQAVPGSSGTLMLTIFVMTADDVIFRAGITDDLGTEVEKPTQNAYEIASKGIEEDCKLALVFPPLILKYPGDIYPNTWSKLLPRTPVFGTLAIDDTLEFKISETVFNGDFYETQMPFILCYGNINPRFMINTVDANNLMPYKAIITKSEGAILHEINNMSALDYFVNIGLALKNNDSNNFLFMPLLVDFKKRDDYDGVPVMRVLAQFNKDGSAILRGNADANSVLNISKFTEKTVIENTSKQAAIFGERKDVNGIISFSCIIRRMAMQADVNAEMSSYAEKIGSNFPYMFGYAGGEICPTSHSEEKTTNRFHNYTLVSLII